MQVRDVYQRPNSSDQVRISWSEVLQPVEEALWTLIFRTLGLFVSLTVRSGFWHFLLSSLLQSLLGAKNATSQPGGEASVSDQSDKR